MLCGVEYPLRPVRAEPVAGLPADRPGGWAWEPKFDGFRCIAFRGAERVVLQSRQLRPLTRYFPEIAAAVAELDREVVLDGELVVCRQGRLDFAALQQRLHPAASRTQRLSVQLPAALVVFDLLARGGRDLRGRPYRRRRRKLEKLLGRQRPHGLVLMPMSTDRAVAREWMFGHTESGIEGVVAKQLDAAYHPKRHAWQKVRAHRTAEAIVGGVLGSLDQPDALVLGVPHRAGRLRIAGRTRPLRPHDRHALLPGLQPCAGDHPWPATLPSSRFGQLPGKAVEYTQVEPTLVVELNVDACFENYRWRHAAQLVRVRHDLTCRDLREPRAAGRPP
jgi:ATP-dependent DNA ligase